MDESYYRHAVAGPYAVILLRIISRVDPGQVYIFAHLFEGRRRIFTT